MSDEEYELLQQKIREKAQEAAVFARLSLEIGLQIQHLENNIDQNIELINQKIAELDQNTQAEEIERLRQQREALEDSKRQVVEAEKSRLRAFDERHLRQTQSDVETIENNVENALNQNPEGLDLGVRVSGPSNSDQHHKKRRTSDDDEDNPGNSAPDFGLDSM